MITGMHYFSQILNKYRYKVKKKLLSKIDISKDANYEFASKLRKSGFAKIKGFNKQNENARKIISFFNEFKSSKDFEKELNKDNDYDAYKYRSHLTKYFDKSLLTNYAEDNFFLDNVEQYFGTKPFVRVIDAWLDRPVEKKFENYSQNYHRDSDDYFLIKTFLCLNNINEDNGPFQYIEGSHLNPWKNISKNHSSFQVEREIYPQNEVFSVTGNQGDLYAADTTGFHKGKSLINGYRCLLTVHYVSKYPKNDFLKDKFIY